MLISSAFDSGRIEDVNVEERYAWLKIAKDSHSDFRQWFHFQVSDAEVGQPHAFELLNCDQTSYVEGWEDYSPCVSYDRESWFRVPAYFDGEKLSFFVTPEVSRFYVAYFAPYSYERHLNLIAQAQCSPSCEVMVVGHTVQGRDLDVLKVGTGKLTYWVTARQHPGETMAEWFIEGFLNRLLDEEDVVAQKLLSQVTFYIVPNMNVDGAYLGNLRTNAAGANLNREWLNPSKRKSPEVYYVREMMHQTGVDFFLDVHGDEAIPYNFVAANEGIPSYTPERAKAEASFTTTLKAVTREFQTKHGYARDKAGQADLSLATAYVGEHFNCLAFTLEMPFKDNFDLPNEEYGWSPARCQQLAYDCVTTLERLL